METFTENKKVSNLIYKGLDINKLKMLAENIIKSGENNIKLGNNLLSYCDYIKSVKFDEIADKAVNEKTSEDVQAEVSRIAKRVSSQLNEYAGLSFEKNEDLNSNMTNVSDNFKFVPDDFDVTTLFPQLEEQLSIEKNVIIPYPEDFDVSTLFPDFTGEYADDSIELNLLPDNFDVTTLFPGLVDEYLDDDSQKDNNESIIEPLVDFNFIKSTKDDDEEKDNVYQKVPSLDSFDSSVNYENSFDDDSFPDFLEQFTDKDSSLKLVA